MRSHRNELAEDEVLALYCGDRMADTLVECENCAIQTLVPNVSTTDEQCCSCGKFFVYRPWWEW